MEAATILRIAADQIDIPDCWGRCRHPEPDCPCAIGHIERVDGASSGGINAAYRALSTLVTGVNCSSVVAWNDDPKTTASEVATKLRAAAASVEH